LKKLKPQLPLRPRRPRALLRTEKFFKKFNIFLNVYYCILKFEVLKFS
jgi:hypothetical protein